MIVTKFKQSNIQKDLPCHIQHNLTLTYHPQQNGESSDIKFTITGNGGWGSKWGMLGRNENHKNNHQWQGYHGLLWTSKVSTLHQDTPRFFLQITEIFIKDKDLNRGDTIKATEEVK